MIWVWIIGGIFSWTIISTIMYLTCILLDSMERNVPFVNALFDDDEHDKVYTFLSIVFPLGLVVVLGGFLFVIYGKFCKGEESFFRIILKKLFHKKYVRERMMNEV